MERGRDLFVIIPYLAVLGKLSVRIPDLKARDNLPRREGQVA
jgi:hypothetical protein